MPARRIAIIGAGPIGLEAALFAVLARYEVDLFERGEVAENVRDWGHVRLFSPFGLNVSPWGREALEAAFGPGELPEDDALLTGREFAERYLLPLSRLPALQGCIHPRTEVVAVSRSRTGKGELIGRPERNRDPFRLLIRDRQGERCVTADFVLDCSGTYPHHNWIGAGGMPCPGEAGNLTDRDYRLADLLGTDRDCFAGKTTLVVGGGYSAATAVVALARLAESAPQTRALWITRTPRSAPLERIENDSLPERDCLAQQANHLATADSPIQWLPGRLIQKVNRHPETGEHEIQTETSNGATTESLVVDQIIANVGYRPNRMLYEELQVHECYASSGPMKLAAALLAESSPDCLTQTSHSPETLGNPEPGFFILGSKSYGRNSTFLLKIGIEQIREVFALMGN